MPPLFVQVRQELSLLADPAKAAFFPRFFKTAPGEYGEGDKFLGITVPRLRAVAKRHRDLPLATIVQLLKDPYHEVRQVALFILVDQYRRGDNKRRQAIIHLYLKYLKYVNNWDLVDCSTPYLLGPHLFNSDRSLLFKLASTNFKKTISPPARLPAIALAKAGGGGRGFEMNSSTNRLWHQRIAIMSTFYFIKQGDFSTTLKLAKKLLHHEHDLIHKAVGWMLREVGNRDRPIAEAFLKKHYQSMPRTMLRYAIEKYPPSLRQAYLQGQV